MHFYWINIKFYLRIGSKVVKKSQEIFLSNISVLLSSLARFSKIYPVLLLVKKNLKIKNCQAL